MDAGAEDVANEDGIFTVTTDPGDFAAVLEAMQKAGFEQESADINIIPDTYTAVDKERAQKVMNIVDRLESLDDVQQVSTDMELPDDFEG